MRKMVHTSLVECCGYGNCIALENDTTRVVLGHHCGGRILEYSLKGRNILFQDRATDGWMYSPGKKIEPGAGRCDIGPEKTIPPHPALWLGTWTAAAMENGRARLTSVMDKATGVRLIRDFQLDANSSHLSFKQTIRNISKHPITWCHWSRTFGVSGGICVIPLEGSSRFPHSYIMYERGPLINYEPNDRNIRIRDGFLEILGPPRQPKLGMDSHAGWLGYVMKNDLLFLKRFPVYPDRVYGEIAGLTISIYYPKEDFCELEPIGPMERIAPGQSASFTEDWWLLSFKFPTRGEQINLKKLTQIAGIP